MAKIAHLGTGLIGSGMVETALRRGDAVTVWNRTAEKTRALVAHGAKAAATPAEAVRGAERVHFALSDDASVDAVIDAIGDAFAPAVLVVDHTTTAPAGTAARADRFAKAGIAFLHAPVFMGPQMAHEAKGLMLVAGPTDRVEAARPALASMTGEVWHVGERADLAAAYKLFGNAMLVALGSAFADIFTIARGVGLTPAEAMTVFTKFKPAGAIDARGAKAARGDFAPSFELTMARKDVRLMIETAERTGLPLAILPAIAARMDALIAAGHGAEDYSVVAIDAVR